MKKRLIKIWGIGLTVILLVTMLLAAAPVSAGTLSFSEKTSGDVPSTTNEFLADGSSLIDMAVSTDGQVIYVLADITAGDKIFKSVDGGVAWTEVALPTTLANVQLIAMAPDDSDIVVVAGDTLEAYVSTDAGSSFATLNDSSGNITDGTDKLYAMYDLAISPLSGSERYIAIAGVDTTAVAAGADNGCVFYFNLGATAPVWYNAATKFGVPGGTKTTDAFIAVAFSPNFASDEVMLVVSQRVGTTADSGSLQYHIVSFNQDDWDNGVFDDYPVELETNAGVNFVVNAADIAIDPEYLGGDDASRIVFIAAAATDNGTEVGGYYRMKDVTARQESAGTGMYSIDWDGTDIVAGAYLSNNVYRCADALASSPTVSTSRANKEIGVDDGSTDKVIVRWSGSNVVGVKQGDASAFGVSTDNGKTWNCTALNDSALTTALDLAVSPDGSVLYLLAADGD